MYVNVRIATREVVGWGTFSPTDDDPSVQVMLVDDSMRVTLLAPGTKTLAVNGTLTVTPPAAPPLVYSAETPITGRVTTIGTTPGELLRFPLLAMTGYDVVARLIGVDTGNGAIKKLVADLTVKRLAAGPLQVGATTVTVTHNDAAASTWTVAASFSGNDGIISAVGAAGRTVDWSCRGTVVSFTPAGL